MCAHSAIADWHTSRKTAVLNLQCTSESPGELAKMRTAGPHLRVSDSVHLGWGLGMGISNRFSGDADAAGLGTTF